MSPDEQDHFLEDIVLPISLKIIILQINMMFLFLQYTECSWCLKYNSVSLPCRFSSNQTKLKYREFPIMWNKNFNKCKPNNKVKSMVSFLEQSWEEKTMGICLTYCEEFFSSREESMPLSLTIQKWKATRITLSFINLCLK